MSIGTATTRRPDQDRVSEKPGDASQMCPTGHISSKVADLDAQITAARKHLAWLLAEKRFANDAALATKLLPVLAIAVGDDPFLADFISETQDATICFVIGRRSTKSIGRLLSRIEGLPFGGYVVVKDGRLHNRRQWRVRRAIS